jgi:ubiquinol-cytochrome c reductase iron-sulfur subunit
MHVTYPKTESVVMEKEGVDHGRRRFLTLAATVVGGAGVIATAVPFISSMSPSAKAQAAGAPVEVDLSKLEPGQMLTVAWQGKPVWIVRRTEPQLASLPKLNEVLGDPDSSQPQQPKYCKNIYRAIKPEYFVAVGLCTHLGCSPTFRPDVAPTDLGPEWLGGFFCPCHGSRFDMAGRVYEGAPAQQNLLVPPYHFLAEMRLVVGTDLEAA